MTTQPTDSNTPPPTPPLESTTTALKRALPQRTGQPTWTPVDSPENAVLLENWLFRLRRERFLSRSSGITHDYFVMHLADAVSVIAITPERQLVFVRQFRAGSRRDSLEIPGGLLEPGEDAVKAGARELLEETGYTGDSPYLLGTVWSNPSLMTSRTTFLLITNARKTDPPAPDASEELTTELIHARRVPQLIASGQVDHALVVAGLLWWLAAELPGHAFTMPRSLVAPRLRPLWSQMRISTLMALSAVTAAMIWLSRSLPLPAFGLFLQVGGAALLAFAVFRARDPRCQPILAGRVEITAGRVFVSVMAVIGVTSLVWLAIQAMY